MRRIAPSVESQPDRLEDVRTRIKDAIVFADPSDTGTRHRGVLLHNAWRHRRVLSRTLGITDRVTSQAGSRSGAPRTKRRNAAPCGNCWIVFLAGHRRPWPWIRGQTHLVAARLVSHE
jgi:hypothetical protein